MNNVSPVRLRSCAHCRRESRPPDGALAPEAGHVERTRRTGAGRRGFARPRRHPGGGRSCASAPASTSTPSPQAALHRLLPVGRLTTVAFDRDDPAGWVIARHTGLRNLSPRARAHCVVRCREWAPTGRPAHDRERPRDCDAGCRKGGQVAVFPVGRRRPGSWSRQPMYQSGRFAAPRRRFVRRTSTPSRRPPVESSSRCGLGETRQVSQLRNRRLAGGWRRAALRVSRLLRPRVTRLRPRTSIPNPSPSVTPTESGASLQLERAAVSQRSLTLTRRCGGRTPSGKRRRAASGSPRTGTVNRPAPPVRAGAGPDRGARRFSGVGLRLRFFPAQRVVGDPRPRGRIRDRRVGVDRACGGADDWPVRAE